MILHSIRLVNVRKFADTTIEFPSEGIIGIQGVTGSGKSSILNSLRWAFYGTYPGVTNEELRRYQAPAGSRTFVIVQFTANGHLYTLQRDLSPSDNRNYILCGEDIVTSGKKAVTQFVRHQLLHMDDQTFTTCFYASQGDFDAFIQLNDVPRKKMLSKMLGIDTIDKANEDARKYRNTVRTQAEELAKRVADPTAWEDELPQFEQKVNHLKKKYEEVKLELQQHQHTSEDLDSKKKESDQLQAEAASLEKDLTKTETSIQHHQESVLPQIQEKISSLSSLKQQLTGLKSRFQEYQDTLIALEEARENENLRLEKRRLETTAKEKEEEVSQLFDERNHTQRQVMDLSYVDAEQQRVLTRKNGLLHQKSTLERLARIFNLQERILNGQQQVKDMDSEIQSLKNSTPSLSDQDIEARVLTENIWNYMYLANKCFTVSEQFSEEAEALTYKIEQLSSGQPFSCPTCYQTTKPTDEKAMGRLIKKLETANTEKERYLKDYQVYEEEAQMLRAQYFTSEAVAQSTAQASSTKTMEEMAQRFKDKKGTYQQLLRQLEDELHQEINALENADSDTPPEERLSHLCARVSVYTKAEAEQKITNLTEEEQAISAEEKAVLEQVNERRTLQNHIHRVSNDMHKKQEEIQHMYEKINTLPQPEQQEDVEMLTSLAKELQPEAEKYQRILTQTEGLPVLLQEAANCRTQLMELTEEKLCLQVKLYEHAFDYSAHLQLDQDWRDCHTHMEKLWQEHEDTRTQLLQEENARDHLQEKISANRQLQAELHEKEAESAKLSKLSDLYQSFRIELLAQVSEPLEASISHILRVLTDSKYQHVRLDKNYNLFIFTNGEFRPLSHFSGGEQKMCAFALRMGISRLLLSQSGHTNFNMLVLDEIFGALDTQRQDSTLEVLRNLNQLFPQIFVTSHMDYVKGMFDHTLFVDTTGKKTIVEWSEEKETLAQ